MILRYFFLIFFLIDSFSAFSDPEPVSSILERAKTAFDKQNYEDAYNYLKSAASQLHSQDRRRRNRVWEWLSLKRKNFLTRELFKRIFKTEYEELLERAKKQEELLAQKKKEEAERKWNERKKIDDNLASSLEGKDQAIRKLSLNKFLFTKNLFASLKAVEVLA